MLDIFELNGTISLDTSGFAQEIDRVVDSLDRVHDKFGTLNGASATIASALGNIGADIFDDVTDGIGRIASQSLDATRYTERMEIAFTEMFKEDYIDDNTVTKRILDGYSYISVQDQIAQATNKTKAEQKDYNKVLKAGATASQNLENINANILRTNEQLANPKLSPGQRAQTEARLHDYQLALSNANAAVDAAAQMKASEEATTAAITAGGAKRVARYRTEEEFVGNMAEGAEIAQKKMREMIPQLENIAILSPFNRRQVSDTFFNFSAIAGFDPDKAKAYTQMITDLAAAKGIDGSNIEGIAYAIGKVNNLGKLQAREAKSLILNRIPIYDLLEKKLGKSKEEIMEMQKQGKLSADVVMPLIEKYLTRFQGAAEAQAGTITGTIESLKDIQDLAGSDFFRPIFQALVEPFAALVDAFTEGDLRQKVRDAGAAIAEGLKGGIKTAFDTGGAFFGALFSGQGIGAAISAAITTLFKSEIFADVKEKLAPLNPVFDVLKKIYDFVTKDKEKVVNGLKAIAVGISTLTSAAVGVNTLMTFAKVIAVLTSPIGILAAAVAGLYLAWENNWFGIRDVIDKIKPVFEGTFSTIVDKVGVFFDLLNRGATPFGAFRGALEGIIPPDIQQKFKPFFDVLDGVQKFLNGDVKIELTPDKLMAGVNSIIDTIRTALGDKAQIKKLLDQGALLIANFLEQSKPVLENALTFVGAILTSIAEAFGKIAGAVIGAIVEFIASLFLSQTNEKGEQFKAPASIMITKLAEGIAALVPKIVEIGVSIAAAFITGIANGLAGKDILNLSGTVETLQTFAVTFQAESANPLNLGNNAVALAKAYAAYRAKLQENIDKNAKPEPVQIPVPVDPKLDTTIAKDDEVISKYKTEIKSQLSIAMNSSTDNKMLEIEQNLAVKPVAVIPNPQEVKDAFDRHVEMLFTSSTAPAGATGGASTTAPIQVQVPIEPIPVVASSVGANVTGGGDNTKMTAAIVSAVTSATLSPQSIQSVGAAIQNLVNEGVTASTKALGLQAPYTGSRPYKEVGKPIGDAISQGLSEGMTPVNTQLDGLGLKLDTIVTKIVGSGGISATMDGLTTQLSTRVTEALNTFRLGVVDPLNTSLDHMSIVLSDLITKFGIWAKAVENFKTPPVITPHSPTPFEVGLRGIASAVRAVNNEGPIAFGEPAWTPSDLTGSGSLTGEGAWNPGRDFEGLNHPEAPEAPQQPAFENSIGERGKIIIQFGDKEFAELAVNWLTGEVIKQRRLFQ